MGTDDAGAAAWDAERALNDWLERSGDGHDTERAALWQALALTRRDA